MIQLPYATKKIVYEFFLDDFKKQSELDRAKYRKEGKEQTVSKTYEITTTPSK